MVMEGDGKGKKRVIKKRIENIIQKGIEYKRKILEVKLKKKEEREMKESIGNMVGGDVEGMKWIGKLK